MSLFNVPDVIRAALSEGAILSTSISGGKDSQAMLNLVNELEAERHEVVHADLGRAEWPQTPAFVEQLADEAARTLHVVRRVKGDLVQRIEERLEKVSTLTGKPPAKPFWPSAAQRYCTSDLKRGPIQKQQRTYGKTKLLISCMGMRAEESRNRAKKPVVAVNRTLTCKRLREMAPAEALSNWDDTGRLVLEWLPLHQFQLADVWSAIGTSTAELTRRQELYKAGQADEAIAGWPAHVAYVYGNERLSCALCVLAGIGDLCNGKKHHPELYAKYVELEEKSGFTFQDGRSLKDLPG